jgi:energy-coupling factor transporter ATP-binding protein EcfA2
VSAVVNEAAFWGGSSSTPKKIKTATQKGAKPKPTPEPRADVTSRFFFDGRGYFVDSETLYIPLPDVASVRRHLKSKGCHGEKDLSGLRPDEHALNRIQTTQFVTYAGPLAGYERGLHMLKGGKRVLVTESPIILIPAPGAWETLNALFTGLFGHEDLTQLHTFYGWLKLAFEGLQHGKYRPGQALALAGPRGCGKSLLIDILKCILGGRTSGAYEWLSGKTSFNLSCAGSELLVVDDKAGSSDPRARMTLSASIKSSLFASEVRIEGKHKNAFDCRPIWRLVFALNDEPENLLVLPPLNEDVLDKITLLRCHHFTLPMPAHTLDEKALFWKTVEAEIPAFLHWLNAWEIPAHLKEERCGVKFYHHPELVDALQTLSPEAQLWAHICEAVEANQITPPAKLSSADIQRIITSPDAGNAHAARNLLRWSGACGSYLGRLASSHPEHVRKAGKLNGIERWEILSAQPF